MTTIPEELDAVHHRVLAGEPLRFEELSPATLAQVIAGIVEAARIRFPDRTSPASEKLYELGRDEAAHPIGRLSPHERVRTLAQATHVDPEPELTHYTLLLSSQAVFLVRATFSAFAPSAQPPVEPEDPAEPPRLNFAEGAAAAAEDERRTRAKLFKIGVVYERKHPDDHLRLIEAVTSAPVGAALARAARDEVGQWLSDNNTTHMTELAANARSSHFMPGRDKLQ